MSAPYSARSWLVCLFALVPATLLAAPIQDSGKGSGETSVEKVRKALQQPVTLEFKDKTIVEAIAELKDKTKLNLDVDECPEVLELVESQLHQGLISGAAFGISINAKDMKARDVLQQILAGANLTYVILGDRVLVTTETVAMKRQLKQHVSLDLDAVPFNQAIKQLARETGANLVIDAKLKKEVEAAVTLQLDDVRLETAVRLLAESAGLKPVRLGNVIYLTSKTNANELRADPELFQQGDTREEQLLEQMKRIAR